MKHIHLAAKKLWLIGIVLIILVGVLSSLGKLLLPTLSAYRVEIERSASEWLGAEVSIRELTGGMYGIRPEIILHDVRIASKHGAPDFRLGAVRVGLDLKELLLQQRLAPAFVVISDSHFHLKRRSDGSVVLEGLEGLSPAGTAAYASQQWAVRIEDSVLLWENQSIGAPPLPLRVKRLDLALDGKEFQIDADLAFVEVPGDVRFSGDFKGTLIEPGGWSARVFIALEQVDLGYMLAARTGGAFDLENGIVSLGLWSNWQKGRLKSISGNIDIRNLLITGSHRGEPLQQSVEQLSSWMSWRSSKEGWRFDLDDLYLQRNGSRWPDSTISVVARFDEQARAHIRAGASFLRVQDLAGFLKVVPPTGNETVQRLAALEPAVDLHDFRLLVAPGESGKWSWFTDTRFDGLTTVGEGLLPGLDNISGRIRANDVGGEMAVDTREGAFFLGELFRHPIVVKRAEGSLDWRLDADGNWQIGADRIVLDSPDIETVSRLRMTLPGDPSASVFLDMQTDFRNGDGTAVPRYLPVTIMSEAAVGWLDDAFVQARITEGGMIFRGNLSDFPFPENNGRFQILFDVEQLELRYRDGWPNMRDGSATIQFDAERFDSWITTGRIYDSTIESAHLFIDSMPKDTPLRILGEIDGPLSDAVRLLTETSLADDYGYLVRGDTVTGRNQTTIDLSMPFDERKNTFKAVTNFNGATIDSSRLPEKIDAIDGQLTITQDSLSADDLRFSISGIPLRASISPSADKSGLLLSGKSRIDHDKLHELLPAGVPSIFTGSSEWLLTLLIPYESVDVNAQLPIELSSDLRGMAVDLPEPLGKNAATVRNVSLKTVFAGKPGQNTYELGYSDVANVRIVNRGSEESRLAQLFIHFGNDKPASAEDDGIFVSGNVPLIDYAAWKLWGDTYFRGRKTSERHNDMDKMPVEVNLNVAKLVLVELEVNHVILNARKNEKLIQGNVASDIVSGSFSFPDDFSSGTMELDLDYIWIDTWDEDAVVEGAARAIEPAVAWDPTRVPPMHIKVSQLYLNEHPVGRFELLSERTDNGQIFNRISVESKLLALDGHARWVKHEDMFRTYVNLKLSSDDIGEAIRVLRYTSGLAGGKGEVEFDVQWSGSLNQFDLVNLEGRGSLDVRDGGIKEVNPGVGRVLGLVNLSAIGRRLRLDFSDALGKGMYFDKLSGDITFADKQAVTDNLLLIAPSAKVLITGSTNLAEETYDQVVEVTPNVRDTISVAGAIAGGPVVGAALYVTQAVFHNQVDKISRQTYKVSGDWRSPEVTKTGSANWSLGQKPNGFDDDLLGIGSGDEFISH